VRPAGARLASRFDLAALGQKPAQAAEVLVVDHFDLVDAELADLTPRRKFSAAAGAELARSAARSGARAARSTGGRCHDHGEMGSFLSRRADLRDRPLLR